MTSPTIGSIDTSRRGHCYVWPNPTLCGNEFIQKSEQDVLGTYES
jgi:hypothetical protein